MANMSLGLVLFAYVAILDVVLVPWFGLFSFPVLFYTLLTGLNLYTHCQVQYSDPGAIPLAWTLKEDNRVDSPPPQLVDSKLRKRPALCGKCLTIKPRTGRSCPLASPLVLKLITAPAASVVSFAWIIIVPGSTTAWLCSIKSTFFSFFYTPSFPRCSASGFSLGSSFIVLEIWCDLIEYSTESLSISVILLTGILSWASFAS